MPQPSPWLILAVPAPFDTSDGTTAWQHDILLYNSVIYGQCDFLLYDGCDVLMYDGMMYDRGIRCPFEKLQFKNVFACRTTYNCLANRIPKHKCLAFHMIVCSVDCVFCQQFCQQSYSADSVFCWLCILPTVVFCWQFCWQAYSANNVFCRCHVVLIESCHPWLSITLEKTWCPALHLYKAYSSKGLLYILGHQMYGWSYWRGSISAGLPI